MRPYVLILTLALMLSGAGITVAASPGQSDTRKIAAIERATAQLRGLAAIQTVPAKVLGDVAFNAVIRAQIKRDTPDAELSLGQREERILGLLSGKDNLQTLTYGAQVKDIIGVYDYITRRLYVRNHGNLAFGIDRYVLAHEYTHALQDQHFHLSALLPDQFPLQYRNSDMVEAHRALTEGDAVNTQYLYIAHEYTQNQLHELLASQSGQHAPAMPKSMQRNNLFPYTTGYDFVHKLYAIGGEQRINAAFARPPSSTYQILHPAAYLHGWKPSNVPLHAVSGLAGWQQTDDDVLGALGYELVLWQYLGKRTADRAVNGYRGDRYVFLSNAGKGEMLFKSQWTSAKAAELTQSTWVASLRARWRHAQMRTGLGTVTVIDPNGAVYLHVKGTSLTVAYAHTLLLARQLGMAPTT